MQKPPPDILIVRRRASGDHDPGRGAWKVAYADFVTAMMAFFLLLWLLNVTTDDQKLGIAQYFAPENVSKSTSGTGAILDGKSLSDAALPRDGGGILLGIPAEPSGQPSNVEAPDTSWPPTEVDAPVVDATNPGPAASGKAAKGASGAEASTADLQNALAEKQDQDFETLAQQIKNALDSVPEMQPLKKHLLIDKTAEGLRVQIVDQENASLFAVGSSEPGAPLRRLVALIAPLLSQLPNPIVITGHTDALPYRPGAAYSNWELSIDRANACRRALVASGVPRGEIISVMGKAGTEPLVADATDPRNRRISLVLLRDRTWAPSPPAAKLAAPRPVSPPASRG